MLLFINSIMLAPLVALRMILPLVAIFLASAVVWPIANIFMLGYADHIIGPVTSAFITLYGIRAALELKGDKRGVELTTLATYSVAFGVIFLVLKTIVGVAAMLVLASMSQVTFSFEGLSLQTLTNIQSTAQSAFDEVGLPWNLVVLTPFLITVPVLFAVPMAAVAQSCGRGAASSGLFWGIGKSALPLFIIFFVSYALQFYFGLITLLFMWLTGALVWLMTIVSAPETLTFDFNLIFFGLVHFAGYMCAQAWLWSAAALAFVNAKGHEQPAPAEPALQAVDLRALRKSRE